MPNEKTDRKGFATVDPDQESDLAAKGGPMTGPGNPDDRHHVPKPYDEDLQTQIAAKSKKKEKKNRNDIDHRAGL
jgi:hypothetical protein